MKASLPIHDRGLIFPFCGAVAAIVIIAVYRVSAGAMPPSSIVGNMLMIGLGIGLVLARVGRLGPYNGRLGSPWLEAELDDALTRETARTARFGRQLTIAVARHPENSDLDWNSKLRTVDQIFRCRDGWVVIILPETDQDGAFQILQRIEVETGVSLQATLIRPNPHDHSNGRQIGSELAALINEPAMTTGITIRRQEDSKHLTAVG